MSSFNKVILLGNLTRDPEVRYAPDGKAVASFSIAVNERRKNPRTNEVTEKVDYFDVVAFGKTAEHVGQYLHKGDPALIEGKLRQRRWDDRETGQKRSKVEVWAQTVTFMPKRAPSPQGGEGRGEGVPGAVADTFPGAHEVPEPPVDEGDIPF